MTIHSKSQFTDFEITELGPDDDEISTTRKKAYQNLSLTTGEA
jgi:hypothetical protein